MQDAGPETITARHVTPRRSQTPLSFSLPFVLDLLVVVVSRVRSCRLPGSACAHRVKQELTENTGRSRIAAVQQHPPSHHGALIGLDYTMTRWLDETTAHRPSLPALAPAEGRHVVLAVDDGRVLSPALSAGTPARRRRRTHSTSAKGSREWEGGRGNEEVWPCG